MKRSVGSLQIDRIAEAGRRIIAAVARAELGDRRGQRRPGQVLFRPPRVDDLAVGHFAEMQPAAPAVCQQTAHVTQPVRGRPVGIHSPGPEGAALRVAGWVNRLETPGIERRQVDVVLPQAEHDPAIRHDIGIDGSGAAVGNAMKVAAVGVHHVQVQRPLSRGGAQGGIARRAEHDSPVRQIGGREVAEALEDTFVLPGAARVVGDSRAP
jgi:hypothetical protein